MLHNKILSILLMTLTLLSSSCNKEVPVWSMSKNPKPDNSYIHQCQVLCQKIYGTNWYSATASYGDRLEECFCD